MALQAQLCHLLERKLFKPGDLEMKLVHVVIKLRRGVVITSPDKTKWMMSPGGGKNDLSALFIDALNMRLEGQGYIFKT